MWKGKGGLCVQGGVMQFIDGLLKGSMKGNGDEMAISSSLFLSFFGFTFCYLLCISDSLSSEDLAGLFSAYVEVKKRQRFDEPEPVSAPPAAV